MIRGSESLLYDAVYAGIQDQVYVMKPAENTYVYEFLNESAKKATGLSDQVIGQTFEEVFSQNIASVLITEYDKVMQKKDIIIYEDEYVVDNQTRHSNITLSPILNKQGNVDVIVGVVKDITNQKNAERELSHLWNELNKSKKRYQSLFKDNSDAIISFDLEGRITNGNPQVQDITGFKPIELIGKTCNAILDEESTAKLLNLINQPSSGKTAQLNVEITNRSNQIKSVSVKVSPLILNQKIQGTYAIFHDLTKEIETIKKWEESEERFRIIAEHAHDMISLLNYQGRIIYASPSYKRIVGFDNQEYTGKIFLYHIHPEDQERLQEIVVNSIKNGTPFSLQTRHYTMDGSYIWVEANGAPVLIKQIILNTWSSWQEILQCKRCMRNNWNIMLRMTI
ncbi:hypothetical protein JCM21714_4061 [Gracilibacillus boraciitolerans JCM 21714]|uniref:Uncharacterized protein n=1 Tax=Gracilibacillus boraciitolerans JCM 21714 TaxID=1298598 RepID=W4VNS2_9BACI|nr:PAS domain-containing protein [Gracilibacillus boraciitolerans]GAE94862.1 hypothetical protein JCM21714_4061 [Gracilibacillus boraciitolerans JCM 21714]